MVRTFLLPLKKYISRAKSCSILGMSLEDFTELAILLAVAPAKQKQKQCLDHMDTIYYRIPDVQKMIDSELFVNIHRRNKLAKKRALYKGLRRYKHDVKIDYKGLVTNKYPSFSDAVNGLPFSVKLLYVKKRIDEFGIVSRNATDAPSEVLSDCTAVLASFFDVIKQHFPVKKCLIGKNGFYLATEIFASKVEWFVPFKLEEKKESKVIDTLVPLCLSHVRHVTEHLQRSVTDSGRPDTNSTLQGMTFGIQSALYTEVYDLVIKSSGGNVSDTLHRYVVTDREVDAPQEKVVYVQPQFIFDALNSATIPDIAEYIVGRKLPEHTSAFRVQKTVICEDDLLTLSKSRAEAYVAGK